MRTLLFSILLLALNLTAIAQCEDINISIASSNESTVNLFVSSFNLVLPAGGNTNYWFVDDLAGNIIHRDTTSGQDEQFSLFNHNVMLTDSMHVTVSIHNSVSNIICEISDTLTWTDARGFFEWAVLSGNTGMVVSSTDEPAGFEVKIFPNPSAGVARLSLDGLNTAPDYIDIYNSLGQKVLEINPIGQQPSYEISLGEQGIYFVRVWWGNKAVTRRLVVR